MSHFEVFSNKFGSKDDFAKAQKQDYVICLVQNWHRHNQKPDKVPKNGESRLKTLHLTKDKLLRDDELLYFIWSDSSEEEVRQIVTPGTLRLKLLDMVHSSIGHKDIYKNI